MATVVLCRHAESTWNREGRIQGWAPTSLTDRGRRQASALADSLAERYAVDRVVASDLQRAQETARPVAAAVGVDPVFRRAWRERDFGRFQGTDIADLFEQYPQFSLYAVGMTAAGERPESGESLLDTRQRVLAAWRTLRADLSPDETVVVVAHGGPISLLVGQLRGLSLPATFRQTDCDNAAVTEIRTAGDPSSDRIVRENERARPDDAS